MYIIVILFSNVQGSRGEVGAPGPSGKDGAPGLNGLDGSGGERGNTGPQVRYEVKWKFKKWLIINKEYNY